MTTDLAAARAVPSSPGTTLVRRALALDALATLAVAVILLLAAGRVASDLGVPASIGTPIGWALVAWGIVVGAVADLKRPLPRLVGAIVAGNLLYAAASVVTVVTGALPTTVLGAALVLTQALAVAGLAAVQAMALQRYRSAAGPSVWA